MYPIFPEMYPRHHGAYPPFCGRHQEAETNNASAHASGREQSLHDPRGYAIDIAPRNPRERGFGGTIPHRRAYFLGGGAGDGPPGTGGA